MNEKVIDKIRKLFSLSDSSNEHEAKQAMLMAQKLMAKHNLEAKDIVINEKSDVHEIECGDYGKKTWKRILASVISNNFRCKHFYNNRGRRGFIVVFVGILEDIEIAKEIYEFAINTIENNQKKIYREFQMLGQVTKGVKKSYAMGFIDGLNDALEEQKEDIQQEYGLVLQTPVVVVDYMADKSFKGSAPRVKMAIENRSAMIQGYDDGMEFGLRQNEGVVDEQCSTNRALNA